METSGREYGYETFPIGEGNMECNDSETTDNGDIYYECPECSHTISSEEIREMNQPIRDAAREAARQRAPRELPDSGSSIIVDQSAHPHRRFNPEQLGQGMLECPNCHHTYEDEISPEMICPRCEQVWSQREEPITNIPPSVTATHVGGFDDFSYRIMGDFSDVTMPPLSITQQDETP